MSSASTESQKNRHPEDYCHRCNGPNIVWCAPSPLWNAVMRCEDGTESYDGIVCPICFARLAQDQGQAEPVWRFYSDRVTTHLPTTMDDRVWNYATWMWEDAS